MPVHLAFNLNRNKDSELSGQLG